MYHLCVYDDLLYAELKSMNYTRTFFEHSFIEQEVISLNKKDFHHEINVLRKKRAINLYYLMEGVVHV